MIRALAFAACLVALPAQAGTFEADTFQPSEVRPGARTRILVLIRPENREGCALWFDGRPEPPPEDRRSEGWRDCKMFAWGDRVSADSDPVSRALRCPTSAC